MNKRTTYELIIANKADQQSPPDMADAIWTMVSAKLDVLPPPGGENAGSSAAPAAKDSSWWHYVWYIAAVAATAAIAVLLWWMGSHDQPKRPKQKPVPIKTIPVQEPKKDSPGTKTYRQAPVIPAGKKKQLTIYSLQVLNDSALTGRMPKGIPMLPPVAPVIKAPDTATIGLPPVKNRRGVKLSGSRNYKIVPAEEDSLTNKKP